MGTAIAIGDTHELAGFALAGVAVVMATSDAAVLDAWNELPPETAFVILSPGAAQALGARLDRRPDVLTAVMP
jgi:vacuolar-type H+-ATPase subunit F/Vma7